MDNLNILEFKACTCGGVATKKVQSLTKKVHDFRFTVHRLPHYKCQECKDISFEDDVNIAHISEWAYQQKIRDVIWHPRIMDMVNQFYSSSST